MKQTIEQICIIFTLSITCVGVVVESIMQGWEYWVVPLIVIGIFVIWAMHIFQYRSETFRETIYLIYAMLLAFFHGVHMSSIFDTSLVSVLML